MHKSGRPVTFWSAVAMGIGAMVGAGIFALLGQAGAIAASAVYLSFLAGGVIALLSGYSLGRLGARYPSSGGLVEYLVQAYGEGVFSGAMSVMMYMAAVISTALVAKTFGIYAASLFGGDTSALLVDVFAVAGKANKAMDLVFNDIAPKNGIIEIRFVGDAINGVQRRAMVQAIEVLPRGS